MWRLERDPSRLFERKVYRNRKETVLWTHAPFTRLSKVSFKFLPQPGTVSSWFIDHFQQLPLKHSCCNSNLLVGQSIIPEWVCFSVVLLDKHRRRPGAEFGGGNKFRRTRFLNDDFLGKKISFSRQKFLMTLF